MVNATASSRWTQRISMDQVVALLGHLFRASARIQLSLNSTMHQQAPAGYNASAGISWVHGGLPCQELPWQMRPTQLQGSGGLRQGSSGSNAMAGWGQHNHWHPNRAWGLICWQAWCVGRMHTYMHACMHGGRCPSRVELCMPCWGRMEHGVCSAVSGALDVACFKTFSDRLAMCMTSCL